MLQAFGHLAFGHDSGVEGCSGQLATLLCRDIRVLEFQTGSWPPLGWGSIWGLEVVTGSWPLWPGAITDRSVTMV